MEIPSDVFKYQVTFDNGALGIMTAPNEDYARTLLAMIYNRKGDIKPVKFEIIKS